MKHIRCCSWLGRWPRCRGQRRCRGAALMRPGAPAEVLGGQGANRARGKIGTIGVRSRSTPWPWPGIHPEATAESHSTWRRSAPEVTRKRDDGGCAGADQGGATDAQHNRAKLLKMTRAPGGEHGQRQASADRCWGETADEGLTRVVSVRCARSAPRRRLATARPRARRSGPVRRTHPCSSAVTSRVKRARARDALAGGQWLSHWPGLPDDGGQRGELGGRQARQPRRGPAGDS